MSPDVIKAAEFRQLYSEEAGDDPGTRHFSSQAKRVRALEKELAEEKAGRQQAIEKAVTAARQDAVEQAREEFGHAANALQTAVNELRGWAARQLEISSDEVAHVAVAIAGKIVRREIARDDDFVVRMVRRCLLKIVHRQEVRIRVNPEDYARVAGAVDDLGAEGGPAHDLSIQKDRRIERGGCVVETPDFVVDGTPRSQLERVHDALVGDRP